MRAGEQVLVRGKYLRTGPPERIGDDVVDTAMVKVNGYREPIRVPVTHIEPMERSRIRITDVDYNIDRSKLAKTVRRLRQSKNFSQGEVAEALGVTQVAVSRWERGLMSPRLDRIAPLASVLGISVSDMLEEIRGTAA